MKVVGMQCEGSTEVALKSVRVWLPTNELCKTNQLILLIRITGVIHHMVVKPFLRSKTCSPETYGYRCEAVFGLFNPVGGSIL